LPTPGEVYTDGTHTGRVLVEPDAGGSSIAWDSDRLCMSGRVARIPTNAAGQPDYSSGWGVEVVWLFDVERTQDPANISGLTSVTVGLSGAIGLNLELEVEVDQAFSGGSAFYCAPLDPAGATINLVDLTNSCFGNPGTQAFDPATMLPAYVGVRVVADTVRDHPFDFCITALSIQ
jgi:hypothetical protein